MSLRSPIEPQPDPTTKSAPFVAAPPPRLLLVRRVGSGIGGAAKILRHYEAIFSGAWKTETLSAGDENGRVSGTKGPGWWKCLSFARSVNAIIPETQAELVFSIERGVAADLFFTADGVHRRWLEISAPGFFKKLVNPLHHIIPRQEAFTMRSVRRIVCQGEMIATDVRHAYPESAHKIRIIPTGYDPAKFYPHPAGRAAAKREMGFSEGRRMLLFVGSGWKIKNLEATLRTFAAYSKNHDKSSVLLVAGDGRRSRYEKLADSLGVGAGVRFLGRVADVASLMRAADALIMPSLYDTYPNAAIEAIACGCPLIVTETNGARELAASKGVVLPVKFDPVDAAGKIHALISENHPPAEIMAAVSAQTVEHEKRLYLELFSEILAEKNALR